MTPSQTPIDYAAELNAEQLAAVQAPDGPVLIIAAAGTGKTRTLTYRVAWLVEKGVDPGRILLLTFTNKAAREMLDRGRDLVGPAVSGLWGGTFHHLANRLLRRHADVLHYRLDYTILDSDDSRSLVKSAVIELALKDKNFPKPDVLLSLFSLAVNQHKSVLELAADRFEDHPIDEQDIVRVYNLYESKKRHLHAMDFDDLLVNALKLLRDHESIRTRYQEQFQYIMVDEYQDTNSIQAELVSILAEGHRNLLVVGDDFQSIYSWRGADYMNIINFPDSYPDAHVFKLETNYRSVPEILGLANACIAGNPEQFQKELKPVREAYKKPRYVQMRSGDEQARYIIQKISELRREGYPLNNMAILYRAHFNSMELQMELSRSKLDYVITSGVRFFEQVHVKDVVSLLRIIHNPADELAFLRLVCLFPRMGQKTALKVWGQIGNRFAASDLETRSRLIQAFPAAGRALWQKVDGIFDLVERENLRRNPGELVNLFVSRFYDEYAVETYDNYPRRVEDIQELIRYSSQFDSLEDFLNELALVSNIDSENDRVEEEKNSIHLSTIHQAKGLEWDVVFVIWLADGMFPSGRSLDEPGGEAEERRLFYVVTTRAKDELFLCVPQLRRQRDGGVIYYSPSRFITELPPELLQTDKVGFI